MIYDYAFTRSEPFDVVVTVSGQPSYAELRAGRHRLVSDPRFEHGMNVLVDHSELDATSAPAESLRALAASAGREWGGAGVGHLVMLAPQTVAFGLLRLWHSHLSEDLAGRTAVVATLDEARAWLASRADAAQPG